MSHGITLCESLFSLSLSLPLLETDVSVASKKGREPHLSAMVFNCTYESRNVTNEAKSYLTLTIKFS
jgi:hypothetical protein